MIETSSLLPGAENNRTGQKIALRIRLPRSPAELSLNRRMQIAATTNNSATASQIPKAILGNIELLRPSMSSAPSMYSVVILAFGAHRF